MSLVSFTFWTGGIRLRSLPLRRNISSVCVRRRTTSHDRSEKYQPPMMVSSSTTTQTTTTKSKKRRGKKQSDSAAFLAALKKYEPVIGIEVHVQLNTATKAFCRCSTKATRTPNVNVCPICMGHPGALPVLNQKVVEMATKAGFALNCEITRNSRFDRKNYYYVDTAKNYQISQHLFPIAQHGFVYLGNSEKKIGVTRLHMEEDSAKMSHEGAPAGGRLGDSTHSLLDFNRGGMPLIEIVSEPDIRTGVEAVEYGLELQRILRYAHISDCNMQDGSLRCDVNVSLRPLGQEALGTKVELKNLNSFAAVQKSVEFEIERQAAMLDSGEKISQETRTWDEKKSCTTTMRVKEGSADYRYFPEPDIPPLLLEEDTLAKWKNEMPELPHEKRERWHKDCGLSAYDASVLSDDVDTAAYFDEVVQLGADAKQSANWIMGDINRALKDARLTIKTSELSASKLAKMIQLITSGEISGKIAKDLVPELITKGGDPETLVEERYVVVLFTHR